MRRRALFATIGLAILATWAFTTGREMIGAIAFAAEMVIYAFAPERGK